MVKSEMEKTVKNMKYGYARVSTRNQDLEGQMRQLEEERNARLEETTECRVALAGYKQQLTQLAKLTRKYQGPVILAGDFNTWGDKRRVLLESIMARYQLQPVSFEPDERTRVAGLPLDHLFYRGLSVTQAEAVTSDGSDHNPLRVGFHYP